MDNGVAGGFSADGGSFDLHDVVITLKKRKGAIFSIASVIVFFAVVFAFVQTPKYTSELVLQINTRGNNVVDIESVVSNISSDDAQIQSELDVINSRSLIGKVVDKLNLIDNEEFSPLSEQEGIVYLLKGWILGVDKDSVKEKNKIRSATIDAVLENMTVFRKPKSYTILLQMTSESPQAAQKIAQTIANEYLLSQLATKFEATKRANDWLNEKLGALQAKVRDSEIAVRAYREKHDLVDVGGLTVNEKQLSEINTQLILARAEYEQSKAKLSNTAGVVNSTSEVLDSLLIQRLREQEAEVLRKKSDLSNRYGPRHPKMINVTAELSDLRSKIKVEAKRVVKSIENDVNVAQSRVKALEKSLYELQGKAGGEKRAKLSELVREMETNRNLYQSFLSRFKETSQSQGFEQADARIISAAEEPLKPSYPKKKLIVLVSAFLGVMIGTVVAFLLEYFDNTFVSAGQIEDGLGVGNINIVPEVNQKGSFIDFLVKSPTSVYSESLRSIITSIHFFNPDQEPRSVMVTSTTPKEGKSTICSSIAAASARSGKKALLIDADLRQPTVAKIFGSKNVHSLSSFLAGDSKFEQVLNHDEKSGVDYIIASPNTPNSQELLGSQKMRDFVKDMKEKYDIIMIDAPPIMPVSDALVISKIVDATVFVVRWDKTPKTIVKESFKQLKMYDTKIASIVMSRVNLEKQRKYGYGDKSSYYASYKDYYTN